MQRRMVAVLAARQLSLGEGSVGAALGGGIKSDFAALAGNAVGYTFRYSRAMCAGPNGSLASAAQRSGHPDDLQRAVRV